MASEDETTSEKHPMMWPNQQDIPDGVVPTDETTQDENLFEADVDLEVEMED